MSSALSERTEKKRLPLKEGQRQPSGPARHGELPFAGQELKQAKLDRWSKGCSPDFRGLKPAASSVVHWVMESCRHHLRGREATSMGRVRAASVVRSIESTV